MPLVPGSVLIELRYPIEVEGATLEQITMRRPKVRDQLTAMKGEGSDVEQELRLFAHLCEQSPKTLEDLDLADYQQGYMLFEDYGYSGLIKSLRTYH